MRVVLVMTLGLASVSAQTSQVPAMISSVAKLITTVTVQGESYSIYEYDGVQISGDLPVQEFRELLAAAAPELHANERIETVVVTKYHPLERAIAKDNDFQIMTCRANCTKRPDRGASGRILLFTRASDGLRLLRVLGWIE